MRQLVCLSKVVSAQSTSLDDAFECADRNWFVPVNGHDHLPAVRIAPFLMTTFLAHLREAVLPQDSNNFLRGANRKRR